MSVSTANIALTANYAVSADMLDGQHGAFYQDASNINAGTLGLARLNAAVVTNNYNSGVVINAVLTVNALQVNGSIATAIASGGNHLLTRSDSVWLGSGPSTVTLPSAAGIAGRQYTIKKTDSAATQLVIDAGAELIDGLNTTYVLTAQQEYVTLVSDGTGWVIAGSN
jgi:hypothetical protein